MKSRAIEMPKNAPNGNFSSGLRGNSRKTENFSCVALQSLRAKAAEEVIRNWYSYAPDIASPQPAWQKRSYMS